MKIPSCVSCTKGLLIGSSSVLLAVFAIFFTFTSVNAGVFLLYNPGSQAQGAVLGVSDEYAVKASVISDDAVAINFRAGAVDSTSVLWQWNAISGAKIYKLEVKEKESQRQFYSGNINTTAVKTTSMKAGFDYEATLSTCSDSGICVIRATVSAKTSNPTVPTGYVFCANENDYCDLSGNAPVDAAFGANGRFSYKTISDVDDPYGPYFSCNIRTFGGDPISGTFKYCFVKKVTSNPISNPTTGTSGAPAATSALSAPGNSITSNSMVWSWNSVSGASYFKAEKIMYPNNSWVEISSGLPAGNCTTNCSWTMSGGTANTTAYFRVKACNSSGVCSAWKEATANFGSITTSALKDGDLIKYGEQYYLLQNNKRKVVPYIVGYEQYRDAVLSSWNLNKGSAIVVSQDRLNSYVIDSNLTIKPNTFILKWPSSDKLYNVDHDNYIKQVDSTNNHPASYNNYIVVPEAFFANYTILSNEIINQPVALEPPTLSGKAGSSSSITWSWTAPASGTWVNLKVSEKFHSYNPMTANNMTVSSRASTNLKADTYYDAWVQACASSTNCSAWSSQPVTVKTLSVTSANTPNTPTDLEAMSITDNSILWKWTTPTGATVNLKWIQSDDENNYNTINGIGSGQYLHSNLKASTGYEAWVQACISTNCSSWSAIVKATTLETPSTQKSDLTFSSSAIRGEENTINLGQPITFYADVKNNSSVAAGNAYIKWYVNGFEKTACSSTENFTANFTKTGVECTFTIDDTNLTSVKLEVKLDPYNSISETKEDNNVLSLTLPIVGSKTPTYEYSWSPSDNSGWGTCANGTQTRTVACKNNLGNVVLDGFCTGTKPATSQSCTVDSNYVPILTIIKTNPEELVSAEKSGTNNFIDVEYKVDKKSTIYYNYDNGTDLGGITIEAEMPTATGFANLSLGKHTLKIKACNPKSTDHTTLCSERAFTYTVVASSALPNTPTGLKAETVTNNCITWSWDNMGTVSYELKYGPTLDGSTVSVPILVNRASCLHDELTPNTTYYAWVKSCNGGTCSSWSQPVTAKTLAAQTVNYSWVVKCQDNNGNVVADSFCSGTKPTIGSSAGNSAGENPQPEQQKVDYTLDTDLDGLSDYQEGLFDTLINNVDSDGDGYEELMEIYNGYNPNSSDTTKTTNKIKSYGKLWLVGATKEAEALATLKKEVKDLNNNVLPNKTDATWKTMMKAFVYGGYSPEEILDVLLKGVKSTAVHPSIEATSWRARNNPLEL